MSFVVNCHEAIQNLNKKKVTSDYERLDTFINKKIDEIDGHLQDVLTRIDIPLFEILQSSSRQMNIDVTSLEVESEIEVSSNPSELEIVESLFEDLEIQSNDD
jgi:hypothetical protein